MMSEERHRPDEGYLHIPTGSLWIAEPSFARDVPADDWAYAADWLRDLMPVAAHVNEALTIALGDAQKRLWQEHRRADERESTPDADKERFGLSPGEHERLQALLHRCDHVNNAQALIEMHVPEDAGLRGDTLEGLEKLSAELNEEFRHYKRELGVPERGRPE